MKRIIKRIAITILAFLVILNGLVIPNASAVLADENAVQEMATVEEAMETTSAAEETVVASFVEEGLVYQEETQVIPNVPEVEPSGETYVEMPQSEEASATEEIAADSSEEEKAPELTEENEETSAEEISAEENSDVSVNPTDDTEEEKTEEIKSEEEQSEDADSDDKEKEKDDEEESKEESEESESKEEKKEETVNMPAKQFTGQAGNVYVSVLAGKDTFPEGTEMKVTPVSAQTVIDAVQDAMQDNSIETKDVKAVDITFFYKGKEIQPANNHSVRVSITTPGSRIDPSKDDRSVVHIDDAGEGTVVENTSVTSTNATFNADSFSVYVVVESIVPRLTVTFKNGDTDLATMYVKGGTEMPDSDAAIAQIIYDPGAGSIPAGQVFKGWTTDPNYTNDTTLMSIEQVRSDVKTTVSTLEGDSSVTYYAAIFKQYTVTYVDGEGVTLGSEVAETPARMDEASYEVNQGYSTDDTHNFEGWIPVDGASNIKDYPSNAHKETIEDTTIYYYANEDIITLTGNVKFSVNAPEGHWLVFDENGKGGTYNAPQFLKGEEKLDDVTFLEMVRKGYTFGGWYTDKDCTDGKEFSFAGELSENTTIYAKWTAVSTASYTVIFWTQNLNRTGYEVAASKVVENGAVDADIPYTSVDNGSEDYVTGFGNDYGHYTGFCLTEASKNQHVKITPEGDAVLNLYYDRIVYNFKFYLYRNGTQNNRYDYANNSGNGSSLNDLVTWHSNQTAHPSVTGYTIQSETVSGGTYYYFVMQAYYGEDISSKWPTYSSITGANGREAVSFVMMVGTKLKPNPTNQGSGTVKGVITKLDENILGATNDANGNYVVVRFPDSYYNWRYHIWFETVEGETYPEGSTRTYNGKTYYEIEGSPLVVRSSNTTDSNQNAPQYSGFEFKERRNENWNGGGHWTTGNNPTLYHLNFVYDREKYKIEYFDGNYVDGNGNQIQNKASHLLHESVEIGQGAVISDEYKNYVPTAPEEGYVFEGWYLDEGCTTAYTWTTMPVGGITVYAKWRQIQYRVFLHPNAGTDSTLDWGSDSQEMNFRKSFGEKISVPDGTRTGYDFYGWYTDEKCTKAFSPATILNESTVTTAYDKTTHMTDPMDKWGNGATTNNDVDRPWITKEYNLYAKWSAKIVGADGIGILYNANGGSNAPSDTKLYKDSAYVVAGSAATPPANKLFDHWVVQTWNGSAFADTETTVLPGESFQALKENAKITDATTGDVVKPEEVIDDSQHRYNYTIQLKAVYKDPEKETPTHIYWYQNDGTEGPIHTDPVGTDPLRINESVGIQGAPTRTGYKFVGWAKVYEPTDTDPLTYAPKDVSGEMLVYYNSANGKYYTEQSFTTEATLVAADEQTPYQALVAVWQTEVTAVITGSTKTVTYNGSEQSNTDYSVTYYVAGEEVSSLPNGVTFTIAPSSPAAKRTDAGKTEVQLSGTLTSTNDSFVIPDNAVTCDTTYNGKITLIINPASVTLKAVSDTKTYTGSEQTISGFAPSVAGLVFEGVSASGSGKDKGQYDVTFTGVTVNETKDTTGNYVVTGVTTGTLTITPAPVTIKTGSASKAYDGKALTKAEASITGLVNNETASVTATGSQTEVGSSSNTYSISWGTAKAANYTITEELGTLEVTTNSATVTLTAASDSKTYDGTALKNAAVTAEGLPEGFTVTAAASGSQTDAGSSANVVNDGYVIKNAAGEDKTANFTNVKKVNGTLTVNKASVTIKTGSASKAYDGKALTNAEASIEGLVNGETATVTANGSQTEVGSSSNTYSIDWGTTNKDNYTVTENLGTLTITKSDVQVVLTAATDSKTYDGKALTNAAVTASGLPEGFTVTASASGSQTDAGSSANVVNDGFVIKNAAGEDKTANFTKVEKVNGTLTVNPADVTIKTGSASKAYDGTALTKAEASIEGLKNNETATVTATGSQTEVGTSSNTYSIDWGTTNKNNYKVIENLGTLEVFVNAEEITLTAPSDSKIYDGTALTADGTGEKKVTASGLPEGFTVVATARGSQTDAGSSANVVNDGYVIKNAEGADKTANFTNVKKVDGTLTVSKAAVTIKTGSASKEYDGTALTKAEASITGLKNNETATVTATGSQTEVGSSSNTYSIDWGKTKKDNYTITEELGTLEVTKNSAEVTLTAPSDSKTYDGTALTADGTGEKKVTASGLPEGFTVVATASGSQTDAGSSANVVNDGYVIKNAEGADKTANFSNVKKVDGTLTVNKAAMTINVIGNKDSKEYNGSEQKVEGFKLNSESKFYDKAKVSFSGSAVAAGTEVGTYPMGLKADQFSYSNANINVTFNVTDGELVITEAPEPGPGPDDDDPEPGPDDDEPEPEPGPDDDDPTPVPGDDDEPTPGDDDEPTPAPVPGGDEPTPVPGGGPDIVPVNPQPVPVPPAEPTIDDDPTPRTDPVPTEPETETIPSDPTPKGKPMKVWALLNLILSIITVILGIIMVITFAIGKKDDDEDEDKEHVEKASGKGEEEDEKKKHRNALKFLGLIPAIGTVILFLLTEDMTAKMVFTDWWTIPTAIITLIAIVLMIVIKNKKNKQEDEEKPEEV